MITKSIFKTFFFAFSLVFIISCDSDFNTLGSDIIEGDIHHDNMTQVISEVIAYDKASGPVQANNLPLNSLGIYENPIFGKTIAHFVTQLELATVKPSFTDHVVIDSVYLYVPYYTKRETINADTGESTYSFTEDAFYGSETAKMKLEVRENGYFLRSTDPATATTQKYYSDDFPLVEAQMGELLNTDPAVSQNTEFTFSKLEVQRKFVNGAGETKVAERFAPGMFLYLKKEFFQQKIVEQENTGTLLNNNVFKEWFRGLYFNIEQTGAENAMAMLRFGEGKIVIRYKEDRFDLNGDPVRDANNNIIRNSKTLNINLKGNTINFFENTFNPTFTSAITASSPATGDDQLYVKGGEGSMVFIRLNQADLDALKEDNQGGQRLLINDANLSFYVNTTAMATVDPPLRVYLYDVENRRPLVDYYIDGSANAGNTKLDKRVHGGILQTDGTRTRYRISLTNHINNIVNKDSTNVTLGLVVTDNINYTAVAALKNPFSVPASNGSYEVKSTPLGSVFSPPGVILYGSNIPAGDDNRDQRVKLEIFYTKPN